MIIQIEGYRSHNQKLNALVQQSAEFYAEVLLGKRMAKNIYLDIKLTKDLKKKEKAYGFCHIIDHSLSRPREFMIELDGSVRYKFDHKLSRSCQTIIYNVTVSVGLFLLLQAFG